MKIFPAALLLAVSALTGCTGSPHNPAGHFESCVEMSDTGSLYDLWLCVRMPAAHVPDSLKVNMGIIAPGAESAASDAFMVPARRAWIDSLGADKIRCCKSGFSFDVECLWRSRVRPLQYGKWIISCSAEDTASLTGAWIRAVRNDTD